MPEIEGAGVLLQYREHGAGPPVLIVHGMASDAESWAPAARELAARGARVITYDRRGYGASGAPDTYTATTVQEQAEDAGAVLERLEARSAVAVGDGFGALVVLELLVRRSGLLRAVVLAEPPLFAFVPEATEALAAERGALEDALREDGPGHAVQTWLAETADRGRVQRARIAHRAFFADYGGLASWSPSRRELRAIAVPVALVTGPASAAHVVAAADAAAALIPGARRSSDGDVVAAAVGVSSGR